MTSVFVEIRSTDLPGRRCGPNLEGRLCLQPPRSRPNVVDECVTVLLQPLRGRS